VVALNKIIDLARK